MQVRPATKVSIIYFVVAALWIFLSDELVLFFFHIQSRYDHMVISILKGLLYVIVTTFLLYKLIRKFYHTIDHRLVELQDRQQELSELQQITRTGLWEYNFVTGRVIWSQVSKEIFEIELNTAIGVDTFSRYVKQKFMKRRVQNLINEAQHNHASFDLEVQIQTEKGKEKWIRLVGQPVLRDGKCERVFGSYQDITESRQAQTKLMQLNRLYNFIIDINQSVVRDTDIDTLFKGLCKIAVNVGKFSMAWVGKPDMETGQVIPVASYGDETGYLRRIRILTDSGEPEGNGPTGFAIREGRHFVCNNVEKDPFLRPWREDALFCGYRSLISLPIMKFGKVVNTFTLYSSEDNYFDENEIELLKEASADISYALENLEREHLRKMAELRLTESEEQYREIVETANEGIWMFDKDGVTLFLNERMAEILGHTAKEMLGRSIYNFMDEEGERFIKEKTHHSAPEKSEVYDFKFYRKDGKYIWTQLSISRMYLDNNYTGSLVMVTDISDRKESEAKIFEALERYGAVSKATRDVIWDWDIQNDTIVYNQGMKEIFGHTETVINNSNLWMEKNVHPNDQKMLRNLYKESFGNKKQVIQSRYRYRCADNSYKNVMDRLYIMYNNAGAAVRAIGAMQDVTKEMEYDRMMEKTVIDTQEKERQQIGMELHDNVNQLLSASLIYLGIIKGGIEKNEKIKDGFSKIDHFIREAIEEIRRLSHQLAPVAVDNEPMDRLFRHLLNTVKASERFTVNLQIDLDNEKKIPNDYKITFYRILQEQLNNIVKYAHASKVSIKLTNDSSGILFVIADNGIGFDSKKRSNGIGLENIRRRVKLLSGELTINTSPGNGCEIIVDIPSKDTVR